MIVPMEKIRIAGLQSVLDRALDILHKFGSIHVIKSHADRFIAESGLQTGMFQKETMLRLQQAESLLAEIRAALDFLVKTDPGRRELLAIAPGTRDWLEHAVQDELYTISRECRECGARVKQIGDEVAEIAEYKMLFEDFQPLIARIASFGDVAITGLFFREKGAAAEIKIDRVENMLKEITDGAYSIFRQSEEQALAANSTACVIVYPRSRQTEIERRIFGEDSTRIQPMHLPQKYEKDTFAATMANLFKRQTELELELIGAQSRLMALAVQWTAFLHSAELGLELAAKKLRVQNILAMSKNTFWLSGWAPAREVPRLRDMLTRELEGVVLVFSDTPAPDEYLDVPILLENKPWVKPFERLLSFFPPPEYGSVDPTAVMTLFFPVFFGLMLGDIGYGLILGLAAWIARKRGKGIPLVDDITVILFAMSTSSIFFGVMFGEFFGKFWYSLGLPHPLFDRKAEIIPLLGAALAIGGIHLVIGNYFSVRINIARGDTAHAANKIGDIALLVSVFWLGASAVVMGEPALMPAGLLVISLTVKLLAGGAKEIFEVFALFSNVLSYARLMALGIASVILADLATDFHHAVGGMMIGAIGCVGIHAVAFVMGVFSPTIQSIRLHYVEMFGRFYKPGQVKFVPITS